MEPLLRFDNVTKNYPNGVHALQGINLTVSEGEFISVIGPSGSGKSTLLRAINALIPISGGAVLLDGQKVSDQHGQNLRALRRKVGMIFQNYNLVYSLSVLQNVLHGRLGYMPGVKGILACTARRTSARPWTCWKNWACRTLPTTARRTCPAGKSSGWALPGPSCSSPSCCSAMNPSPPWTLPAPKSSWTCCAP